MAMTKCPECGADISSKADACPKCGYNLAKKRKKDENKRSCGCIVLMLVALFFIVSYVASHDDGSSDNSTGTTSVATQAKPREKTEYEKYQERVHRCVIGKHLATYPTNELKKNLVSPKSYVAEDTRCDFAREGETLRDTLTCIHIFSSKNKFGVDLMDSALVKLIPPSYAGALRMDRCQIKILAID